MNLGHNLVPALTCVLIAVGSAGTDQGTHNSDHTAVAMIEVLPYVQPDPLSLEAPVIDVELQREFRRSQAVLMTRPDFFELLVKRQRVQGTKWFAEMDGDLKKATQYLRERSAVDAHKDSSFLDVVVACDDPNDSALIADEMVQMFVELRQAEERARLEARIKVVEGRRDRINQAVRATQAQIESIRKQWGHVDLGEHEYWHPAEARLIRMEERRDDLLLEILEQDVAVTRLDSRRSSSGTRTGSRLLQLRLVAAEKMLREAVKAKEELDQARTAYRDALAARARHERMLEDVELLIDKLDMMHESPDVSRLRPMGPAWIIDAP